MMDISTRDESRMTEQEKQASAWEIEEFDYQVWIQSMWCVK